MQTPEASPDRRKSPLSSLTQKSWRNLRSKIQVLTPSPRDESRGQFVVLSSSLNSHPQRPGPDSPPLIFVAPATNDAVEEESAPPLPPAPPQSRLSESLIPRDEPLNGSPNPWSNSEASSRLHALGEPFDEDAAATSDSDRGSAFSFNRQVSCKYYKDAGHMDSGRALGSSPCGSVGSMASYDSYGSFASYISDASYVSSSDLLYGGGTDLEDPWEEDLSHLDEPDCLSALIAEANEVPSDDDLESLEKFYTADPSVRRVKSAPTSWGQSMHRQLTFSRSGSTASSSFSDFRLKRARSTLSTSSSVWPIME